MITWLAPEAPFPSISSALRDPNGLLAASRDLTVARLRDAYRRGIFPWYSGQDPVLWWSPDPRMVLYLHEFRITRSLAKTLRRLRREGGWTVSLDTDFDATMQACSEPRAGQDGTWITPAIRRAYGGLHERGEAHSVEIRENGVLIGGLYGVAIGRMFFGESMFARRTDASKCALASLVDLLREHGFRLIDCQQATPHLASLGARTLPRRDFLQEIERLIDLAGPDWTRLEPQFPDV